MKNLPQNIRGFMDIFYSISTEAQTPTTVLALHSIHPSPTLVT